MNCENDINNLYNLININYHNKNYIETIKYCKLCLNITNKDQDQILTIMGNSFFLLTKYNDVILTFKKIQNKSKENYEHLISSAYILNNSDIVKKYCIEYYNKFDNDRKLYIDIFGKLFISSIKSSYINLLFNRYEHVNNLNNYNNIKIMTDFENLIEPYSSSLTFNLSYNNLNNINIFRKACLIFRKIVPQLNYISAHCKNYIINKNKKIKIGFISYYFKEHSVTKDRRGIIKLLDRNIFDVYTLFLNEIVDNIGEDIKNSTIYIKLENTLSKIQKQISELELDILIYCEIGMNMIIYYLSFLRFAPIQINTWDHPDTSGVDSIDYFISSKLFEKQYAQKHYSEKLILNNGICTYYYNPIKYIDNIIYNDKLLELCKNRNIYFCPGTLFKILPSMDIIFKKVLEKDNDATIIFINFETHKESLENRLKNILDISRILFIPLVFDKQYFFSLINSSDVLIDTYSFGGGNTSLEAFSINKPIVILPGKFANSRITYGYYSKMNLFDLIANNFDEYIDISIKLGIDKKYNKYICNEIRRKSFILYENIETIYEWNNLLKNLYYNLYSYA